MMKNLHRLTAWLLALSLLVPCQPLGASRAFVAASSQRIDLANEANFDFERTDTFSLCAWVYPTANAFGNVMAKRVQGGNNEGWQFAIRNGTTNLKAELTLANDSSPSNQLLMRTTNEVVLLNAWNHLCFTYTGNSLPSGVTFYLNGTVTALSTIANTLSASILNNVGAQIAANGGSGSPSNFLSGRVAEARVYNITLIANEVATIKIGRAYTRGLVAHLPLWAAQSTEIDLSGNGNNGTVTGATAADHAPVGRYP